MPSPPWAVSHRLKNNRHNLIQLTIWLSCRLNNDPSRPRSSGLYEVVVSNHEDFRLVAQIIQKIKCTRRRHPGTAALYKKSVIKSRVTHQINREIKSLYPGPSNPMHPEPIYVDTSAFYALMDRADFYHQNAKELWPSLLEDAISLRTSNYVVSESLSLIQHRLGHRAASIWYKDILGVLEVHWVDQSTHRRAYELWMNLGRRQHSLVDCIGYVIMHKNQIEKAFSFKPGYAEQGFKLLSRP